MDCARTRELLDAYADGALDAAEETDVRAHLAACRLGCPEELRAIEAIGERMRAAVGAKVEAADFSRLWMKVEGGIEKEQAASFGERAKAWFSELFTYRGPVLAAAAAAVLAVAIAFPLMRAYTGKGPGGGDGLGAAGLVDILSLESSGTVTVWPVAADDGSETTIIWITADESVDAPHEGTAPVPLDMMVPGGTDESRPAPLTRATQGTPG